MNKYQDDVVNDAIGELNRAAAKLAMIGAQLSIEASELDGAARGVVADEAVKAFLLGGQVLNAIDRYKWPVTLLKAKAAKHG